MDFEQSRTLRPPSQERELRRSAILAEFPLRALFTRGPGEPWNTSSGRSQAHDDVARCGQDGEQVSEGSRTGLRTTERRQGSGIWSPLLASQIGKPRHRIDGVARVCRHLGLVHLLRPCFPSKAGWSASGQSLWCVSSMSLPPAVSVCSCRWPDACQVRVCGEGAVGYVGRSSGFGKPPTRSAA